ncbi:hypothetical protein MUG87_06140 [Ectobacillus sp. JY-23]|uniref:hypothetical protein n=1 Tax=Ectobacillus sp. JY-23 TaxID=2933872 RepID=UPI001FF1B884|nr:hypothetical protein [Ectobacillus sp. JY-23]UOY93696.1 hypothetical protein MUG87_06140 [Ectobacillus sp. JY-23]
MEKLWTSTALRISVLHHQMDFSELSENIAGIAYNKNVLIDDNKILVDIEVHEAKDKSDKIAFLATISFKEKEPKIEIIPSSQGEKVLNNDLSAQEAYTRITIRQQSLLSET